MSLTDLVAVARGARVELSEQAIARIEAARKVVDDAFHRTDPVYGLNTGLGHARDERVPEEAVAALQPAIVALHAGTIGDPLPTEVVRAAIATRLNGFARGGAGVSLQVARTLEAMLNRRVHPIVSQVGSVGAADLGHMAEIALVAIGQGHAEHRGRVMPAADALAEADVEPARLRPKDALALISCNGVSIGHASLVLDRLGRLLDAADLVAAMSMEAISANPSIVDPAVAAVRSSSGQLHSSDRIRTMLEGSERAGPRSVQDPLAFRVAPQVHGACRDTLAFVVEALTAELNARADNPLVSIEDGRIISNGNFHPMQVALGIDALRPALAHVGLLSDRRTGHMWDSFVANSFGPDPGDLYPPSPATSGLLLRYVAAARVTRLRQLANPVTLDVPPLDLGVEDHATNAPEAVTRTAEAVDVLEDVLAIELMTAHGCLVVEKSGESLGARTGPAHEALGDLLGALPAGTSPSRAHRVVKDSLLELATEA